MQWHMQSNKQEMTFLSLHWFLNTFSNRSALELMCCTSPTLRNTSSGRLFVKGAVPSRLHWCKEMDQSEKHSTTLFSPLWDNPHPGASKLGRSPVLHFTSTSFVYPFWLSVFNLEMDYRKPLFLTCFFLLQAFQELVAEKKCCCGNCRLQRFCYEEYFRIQSREFYIIPEQRKYLD